MRMVLELAAILALAAVSGAVYNLMCSSDTEKHLPWVSSVYEGSDFLKTPPAKGARAPADGKGAQPTPAPADTGAPTARVEPAPDLPVKDGARPVDGEFPMIQLTDVIVELDGGSVFIDARRTRDYDAGHIPGAISMSPWEADLTEKISKLRGEAVLEAPVVIYCSNSKECEDSKLVGRQLREAGFLDIRIFTGGFPEWQKEKPGSVAKGKEPGSWKP